MISINIRGTGGSGKSTLVKRIMELYPVPDPLVVEGRKRRMGTRLFTDIEKPAALFVPGHYDTACGGCDTIKTPDEVYNLVRANLERGTSVLYEGIMVQDDVTRAVALDKELKRTPGNRANAGLPPEQDWKLHVIRLDTTIEECLASIRARREARGETKKLDEKNTRARYERVLRSCHRLKEAGVTVEKLSREAAFLRVRELLGV